MEKKCAPSIYAASITSTSNNSTRKKSTAVADRFRNAHHVRRELRTTRKPCDRYPMRGIVHGPRCRIRPKASFDSPMLRAFDASESTSPGFKTPTSFTCVSWERLKSTISEKSSPGSRNGEAAKPAFSSFVIFRSCNQSRWEHANSRKEKAAQRPPMPSPLCTAHRLPFAF